MRRIISMMMVVVVLCLVRVGFSEVIFKSNFGQGDFAELGWKVEGPWQIKDYKIKQNNPGPVANFPANTQEEGKLIKVFEEVNDPKVLKLSFDYGWGWGAEDQGADAVLLMLLDKEGNGYCFIIGRYKGNWCLKWAKVTNNVKGDEVWIGDDINFNLKSIMDPSFEKLGYVEITREKGGKWKIYGKNWNNWQGGTAEFTDNTTKTFSQIVLLGTKNFDEQVFNNIQLEVEK